MNQMEKKNNFEQNEMKEFFVTKEFFYRIG